MVYRVVNRVGGVEICFHFEDAFTDIAYHCNVLRYNRLDCPRIVEKRETERKKCKLIKRIVKSKYSISREKKKGFETKDN